MTPDATWADWLRLFLVIVPGTMVLAIQVSIIRYYLLAYEQDREIERTLGGRRRPAGLLPRHVVKVSVSYSLLVAGTLAEAVMRLRSGIGWRVWLGAPALLLGFSALVDLIRYERLRYSRD